MNPSHLMNIPCTILTVAESTADIYGDPTTATTSTSTVCWIDRRGNTGESAEVNGPANWQTETLDLYMPAGTTVTADDRVTVNGATYEVLGAPHEHLHPRTATGVFVSARIRRTT
jgi:hypothetical protein